MNVLVLQRESHVAPGVFSLSVEARITEVLDYLQDNGELTYAVISERNHTAIPAIEWANAIILSKHNSKEALALVTHARSKRVHIIYDVDDLILSFPKYSGASNHAQNKQTILELLDLADTVTVANMTLLNEIRKHRSDSILMPNGIYIEKYRKKKHKGQYCEAIPPRIVFTNADMLKVEKSRDTFIRVLQDFFRAHPNYILDFYGDPFPELHSMPFLYFTSRMSYQDYMHSLISGCYQFAITPLGGSEDKENLVFNRCKNPFKFLNYGAACIPGIYSLSPIYEECIEHGRTGLLVENSYEKWMEALDTMTRKPDLRDQIRNNGLEVVSNNYHIKSSARVMAQALRI